MYEEIKECYICLETIVKIRGPLKCGCNNNYHDDCLTKWLDTNDNKCPICGIIIDKYDFTENDDGDNNIIVVNEVVNIQSIIQHNIVINNHNLVYNKYFIFIVLVINSIIIIFGIIYFRK